MFTLGEQSYLRALLRWRQQSPGGRIKPEMVVRHGWLHRGTTYVYSSQNIP
jgi:hypothetical protein